MNEDLEIKFEQIDNVLKITIEDVVKVATIEEHLKELDLEKKLKSIQTLVNCINGANSAIILK